MAPVIPEYMRVRKYLYSLVYNSDGTDLRIPPENELTRMFGVSRVTVRGAIHGLVDDGTSSRAGESERSSIPMRSNGSINFPSSGSSTETDGRSSSRWTPLFCWPSGNAGC